MAQTPDSLSTPALLDRLLRILDLSPRKPGLEALAELVSAFMQRVPFENVSKLLYWKRTGVRALPTLETYIDGIERFRFGGTCYSNNYYLHLLLRHLGYRAMFCGADMTNPDVHLVNMVSVDGREFLADAGYAAPFLRPLPRDLDEDFVVVLGRDRYVLKPRDENGCSRLELHRDGEHRHGYLAKPIHRRFEYFTEVIEDSFRDSSTFLNSLLLVRLFPNRSIAVHNLTVIKSEGENYRTQQLADRDELPEVIESYFGIPRDLVAEAISQLGDFGDAWS